VPHGRLADTTSPSMSVTSSPPGWPWTSIAWCKYGSPATIALPFPPQPTTSTRTGRRSNSDERVCTIDYLRSTNSLKVSRASVRYSTGKGFRLPASRLQRARKPPGNFVRREPP
jgi:hypothetical protein